jgi:hypothetical protein
MKNLNLVIEGYNKNLNCLLSVKLSVDDPKYSKFGKDFFDDDYINDEVLKYFDYYRFYSEIFAAWYQVNEKEAWFDLRLGDDGKMYAVAGDSEGIKFLNEVAYITLDYPEDYPDHEINFMGSKNDSYWFSFWIDPDGGILKAADCSRSFDFYDDLNNDDAYYSIKEYSFKAALDDLVAHSDDYQNINEDEDEEEEDEE